MTPKRHHELRAARDETRDPIARREFMKLMGAALGLAGVEGCTRAPKEEIVPYVVQPPETRPGRARFYASSTVLEGYATGVLVETHEGRPTKIEGNPDHPASLGASSAFDQASVLDLYGPERARAPRRGAAPVGWDEAIAALASGGFAGRRGAGLHVVLEPTSSPSIARLLQALRARWPEARVHFASSLPRTRAWEGARRVFGRVLEPRYDLTNADVLVALDADFVAKGPQHLRLARQLADHRRVDGPADTMSRLYVVESLLSVTGAAADERRAVRPDVIRDLAEALLARVARARAHPLRGATTAAPGVEARLADGVAADLLANAGRSLVLVGDAQPPEVHAFAHALNELLGNVGRTVAYAPSPLLDAGEGTHDLAPLAEALDAGSVDTLLVLGPNLAYADPRIGARIGKARQSAYLGATFDETAAACTFALPLAHALESWTDARAFDGTLTVGQPTLAPLHASRTVAQVLAGCTGLPFVDDLALVRESSALDDAALRGALRLGLVPGTAFPTEDVRVDFAAIERQLAAPRAPRSAASDLDLVLTSDPHVHDGRFATNAWLLELPAPLTKLTWGNAATLAPETAAPLGIVEGDELEIATGAARVRAPALLVPGQAKNVVGLTLGWGRSHVALLAKDPGTNAAPLRSADPASLVTPGVTLRKTGNTRELALTQRHHRLEGRDEDILQHRTLAEHRKDPGASAAHNKRPLPLYDVRPAALAQWGMAIDLSICTGCSACVVACQAENNVPVVGKDGVMMGRAMHWLRIDTYVHEDQTLTQPMLCQHCEKAPCEYVCPVNATVHSEDGLNQMTYNRCVGTRFCSNNCPYKVRRFNWFDFHHDESTTEQLVHNPDVTVRERGVMEKCTFCVQRIREDEIESRLPQRPGAAPRPPVQTACQQACPTRAITFGNVADPASDVAKLHASSRAFAALNDLGTVPRVKYLARLRNPNPELA
ncbi:MAG: Molybdopterin oxidoreductase, iron-sulfur binding subunit [Labilithrix sp.]|nr:Molybdopterin oxidoreductase, iron-sulfur binding subunit [Labilithrix sp.]